MREENGTKIRVMVSKKEITSPQKQSELGVKEFLEETIPPSSTSSPSARTDGVDEEEERNEGKDQNASQS